MDFLNKPRTWVIAGVTAGALFLVYTFWKWEITRVEVPPGKFLVLVHRWGKDLPQGEIIAPNSSYKGIQLEVLSEGRHFINPIFYASEEHSIIEIPADNSLVVTRLYGNELSADKVKAGDILVEGSAAPLQWDETKAEGMRWDGERGILRKPLGPGSYRFNPHAFDWDKDTRTGKPRFSTVVASKTEEVIVRVLKVGKDPNTLPKERPNPYLVPEGYRGVQEKLLAPGKNYINPFAELVIPVNVQSFTVEFKDIVFPSTDGFILNPHVQVKLKVDPEMAPNLLATLTDTGVLHQGYKTQAEVDKNEILQKIVLPLIRGHVRIEGSKFEGRDFIAGHVGTVPADKLNARDELQKKLNETIPPMCKKQGIIIQDIKLGQLEPQGELAELAKQISEREQARIKREQNKSKIQDLKSEQMLRATEYLTQQNMEKVAAETRLQNAQINAKQRKSVEESRLKTDLANAQIRLDAAKEKAKAIVAAGKAEAEVITLQNEAEVSGIRKAIQGFPSAEAYAQYQIMAKLGPALTEIFASDTSDFAKLFASYLTILNPRQAAAPMGTGGSTSVQK